MTPTLTYAAITIVALLLAGVLGSIESALTPISRARVEGMVKNDTPGAEALLPQQAGHYQVRLEWRQENGSWQLARLQWQ